MKLRLQAVLCAAMLLLPSLMISPALAADEPAAKKRDDSASEKLGLKLSLQCWTYNKLTFFEAVDRAKTLGVKYVEAYPGQRMKAGSDVKMNLGMSDEATEELLKKLADSGVKIVAFGVTGVPSDEKGARKAFEWAKKVGITAIVTESSPNAVHDKLTKEFGIRYALHNHPNTWEPEKVLKAVEGHNPLVGSCSDTGHWARRSWKPAEQLQKLAGRVEHLHFKDLNEFGKGHDVVWGTGVCDPAAILAELKKQKYNGYMSIEFEYGDLKHLDENLPKCVEFFDKTCEALLK